tara:strand:+ start:196 stop:552 length:357 start_codon:yes stop_codon:yes gene_type:complete
MSLSSSLQKASSNILKKLGGNVTLRKITTGSYDTSTGAISETTSDSTVKGLLENITKAETNDLIRAQDKKLTISAKGLSSEVTPQDRIIIAGIEYQIIQVDKNEQNNVVITYELYLRA